jgi:hypothetical protein
MKLYILQNNHPQQAEKNVEEQTEKDRNENLGRSAESQFAGKQLNEST